MMKKLRNGYVGVIVMLALLVPAYSQQEINPTWYDPWAAPNKAVVQHPHSRPANHRRAPEIRSAAPTGYKSKRPSVQTARDRQHTGEIAAKVDRDRMAAQEFVPSRAKSSSVSRLFE
jgi:hypothetical protein